MGKLVLIPSFGLAVILLMNPPILTGIGLIVTGITYLYILTGF